MNTNKKKLLSQLVPFIALFIRSALAFSFLQIKHSDGGEYQIFRLKSEKKIWVMGVRMQFRTSSRVSC